MKSKYIDVQLPLTDFDGQRLTIHVKLNRMKRRDFMTLLPKMSIKADGVVEIDPHRNMEMLDLAASLVPPYVESWTVLQHIEGRSFPDGSASDTQNVPVDEPTLEQFLDELAYLEPLGQLVAAWFEGSQLRGDSAKKSERPRGAGSEGSPILAVNTSLKKSAV